MQTIPLWSEVSHRAKRLAARGRVRLRLARERLAGRGTTTTPPRPADTVTQAQPATVAKHRRPLVWSGGILAFLVLAVVLIIAFWNWDWFKGPISRWVSAQTHREVVIQGHLKAHILTWTPSMTASDIAVSNPSWPGDPRYAHIDRFTVSVRLPALLRGRLDVPLVDVEHPDLKLFTDVKGRSNWSTPNQGDEKPLKLPPIQHLIVRDGHIVMTDLHRRFHLIGEMESEEDTPGSGRGTFKLTGRGDLNAEPISLEITGGPLIDVRRDQPYQFKASLIAGPTRLAATGAIDKPFDFGGFHAQLTGSGRDLADLYQITGLTFPNTPPYQTTGRLTRAGNRFTYDHFSGRVGDSDIAGSLIVDKKAGRRFLSGNLLSRSLDWKDLAQVMGGAPVASKAASPTQKAVARSLAAQGRLLPDAPLYTDRLRAMDADVRFQATAVKANRVRLTGVKLRVRLDHAFLTIDPLAFSFAQGVLDGSVKINGRGAQPVTDADLHLSNYALQNILPVRDGAPVASGIVDGRARLHGVGPSVHAAASTASGTVRFSVPHGEIRQAFAELMGINVGKGLSLLLAKSPKKTDLRCAAADFDVKNGIMQARNITIDTGVVVSQGQGTVNLNTETLNLRLSGKSKKLRLLKLWAPVTVKGSLSHPKLGVQGQAVAAQAGVVGALAAFVHPLAAVVALATPGGAKDVDCSALLARR
ncbi:MAG TPA: AsmA family protein [Caulobacteraceae bacterium]